MKKLVIFILFVLCGKILSAQSLSFKKTDVNSTTQTTKQPVTSSKNNALLMLPANDIATNISHGQDMGMFYKTIQTAGLTETFKSKGPITVFAPNNQAFANLPKGKLDTLLRSDHKYDLIALISYHAVSGIITSQNITHQINSHKGVATFITLTGNKLTARFNENHDVVLIDENGGQSIISRFNIQQNNGLVHIINSVLIPKFKNI